MEQIQNLITKPLTNNQDRVPKAYTRKDVDNSHIAGARKEVTVDAKPQYERFLGLSSLQRA